MDKHNRPSIFWALLLITLGVVLLLNTMQIIPGNVFELLLKLWPLLFIIGGLDNLVQGRGWVWGIISLGLGTIFLLANFNFLEWSSLSLLLKWWPLLLVAVGLDLIFQGRSAASTIIGILLAILIVAGVSWFVLSNSPTAKTGKTGVSQPQEAVTSANVRISSPVGRLEVSGGAADGMLLEGTAGLMNRMKLVQDFEITNGHGSLNLSTSGGSAGSWLGTFDEPLWQMALNEDVLLTLTTESAVGSLALDLTGLDTDEFYATVAVGSLEVTLDPADEVEGKISNPIGKVTILVPEGASVEIRFATAISTQNFPSDYVKMGKTVYSPAAASGDADIRLVIEQPIGLVSIREVR